MDENNKINYEVPASTFEQKQAPALDPKDEYSDEYLDDHMYDDLYYDDMCMSCRHWIGGFCNYEHEICNYNPL